MDIDTTVRVDNPDVQKEMKVQKDGTVYMGKAVAGERVEIVAKRVGPESAPSAEQAEEVADLVTELMNAETEDDRRAKAQAIVSALDVTPE